ncbi:MAG: hypothetical protein JNM17_25720 [Archangium sp.]|nr:hypothetical protein [Archangium sp.]
MKTLHVVAAALMVTACGPVTPDPTPMRCGPSNCTGCCARMSLLDDGTCVTPTSTTSCGASGDTCTSCLDGKSCVAGACDYVPDTLPAGAKQMFITSASYQGDLGGIAGADSKCAAAASGAGLTGTWKAWISDRDERGGAARPLVHAIDRITAAGPWYLMCRDSKKLLIRAFNNKAALQSVPLDTPSCTENGTWLGMGMEKAAWTGTATGGQASSQANPGESANCDGWSSIDVGRKGRAGLSSTIPADWTDFISSGCYERLHLYCFQN